MGPISSATTFSNQTSHFTMQSFLKISLHRGMWDLEVFRCILKIIIYYFQTTRGRGVVDSEGIFMPVENAFRHCSMT